MTQKKNKEEQKYSEAIAELEEIVNGLEDEAISVDELSEKVRRASELIRFCRGRLFKTDEEVKGILKELNEPE